MTDLDLAAIDRELARYRSAADTVGANLLELDADPNRQLLDTAPLTGVTGAAWAEARTALTSVWDWFARFTTFLDAATELRDSPRTRLPAGRERQLADFLTDASIEVSRDDIPLRDRDLLQPRQATNRCTADELLALMTDAFARARDVVARVATAWDDLVPRLAGARARIVGLPKGAEVQGLHDRLDALSDALIADPLSVQPTTSPRSKPTSTPSRAASTSTTTPTSGAVPHPRRAQPARSLRASGHRRALRVGHHPRQDRPARARAAARRGSIVGERAERDRRPRRRRPVGRGRSRARRARRRARRAGRAPRCFGRGQAATRSPRATTCAAASTRTAPRRTGSDSTKTPT